MANQYYERLSEMNPGELADGLAMEAEFDAISRAFAMLPVPHTGGQGFGEPVRVSDAVNPDEAVSLGQLNAAIGEAKLLPIATYGDLNAAAWETLASMDYLLFGTGAQFSNFPATLVAGSTYFVHVRHVIGGAGASLYCDKLTFASVDDASNVDINREFSRIGATLVAANTAGWKSFALKRGGVTPLEALTPTADRIPYYTGAAAAALATLTPFARTLLDDADAAAARATLGAAPDGYGLGAPAGQGGFRSWVLPQFAFGQGGIADEYLVLFPSAVAGPHCIKGEIHSSRGSGNSGNTNTVERINAQSAFNSNILYIGAENLRRFLYFSLLSIDGVQYVALKGDISGGSSHNQLVFYGNVIGWDSKLFTKVRSSDAGVSVVTERLINASNKYHSGNIIGPLSQLGGVPTGAIIEHGSNANGEYVKFADGTMICRAILTCPSGWGTFNYAATFAVTPTVLLSAISSGPAYAIIGSASQATYLSVVYNSAGAPVTSDIFTVAIGRWF